jgi:hypothetical protein
MDADLLPEENLRFSKPPIPDGNGIRWMIGASVFCAGERSPAAKSK